MPRDPGSIFGGLLSYCVNDGFQIDKKVVAEGVIFVILGACSSFVTTYLLSMAGLLV